MELTEKQKKFQANIKDFCFKEVAPHAARIDEISEFPHDIMDKVADFGLMGCVAPKEYGGMGVDTVCYAIAIEELSRVCGSTGITVAAHNSLGLMPILLFGNEKQKEEYLPTLTAGKNGLSSFGLTESNAGSDAGGTKTTAIKEGNKWVLNGTKCFITNAGVSHVLVITAKTENIPGSRGISSFLIDKDTPGFIIGKKENKMGLRGSDTRELAFEDVRLSVDKLLGKEGDGFKQFMIILDGGRISIAAMALGLAQGAFDYCLKYTKDTVKAGRAKISSQAIQFQLANMYTKIQCARHLIYYASRLEDAHKPFSTESAMAKLYASEIATEITKDAIRIVGDIGYTKATPLERIFRDVRLCEIGEGTSEIQRLVISRSLM